MAKKMTKKERFMQILNNYDLKADDIDFINHEIELLEKRNSNGGDKKPTAKQLENADLKTVILDFLADNPDTKFTITDMWKDIPVLANNPEMSNQRISAIVRQLVMDKLVIRDEIKRKAYFSIAKNEW
jgi:hypothetical protein